METLKSKYGGVALRIELEGAGRSSVWPIELEETSEEELAQRSGWDL